MSESNQPARGTAEANAQGPRDAANEAQRRQQMAASLDVNKPASEAASKPASSAPQKRASGAEKKRAVKSLSTELAEIEKKREALLERNRKKQHARMVKLLRRMDGAQLGVSAYDSTKGTVDEKVEALIEDYEARLNRQDEKRS